MNMKRLIALFLTLVLAIALPTAAFAEKEATDDASLGMNRDELVEYYLSEANDVVVTDTHVIFTDNSGRGEISIEKNPQNAAILYGSLTCLWYEAGGTAYMTVGGASLPLYEEQIGRDVTQDEGVMCIADSGSASSWDIEKILAQKPDLIVCSTAMKGYATISGPAEAVGIPVVAVVYESVQDYLKWFKVFCNINGQGELWDEVAEKTAEEIIDLVSNVPNDVEQPKVASIAVYENLKLYTSASMNGAMIRELGGINIADPNNDASASSVEFSLEDLYAADPDVIFMVETDRTGEIVKKTLEELEASPVWNALSAVKNEKVYVLEMGVYLNRPNHRFNEAYAGIAQYLYPDVDFAANAASAE